MVKSTRKVFSFTYNLLQKEPILVYTYKLLWTDYLCQRGRIKSILNTTN